MERKFRFGNRKCQNGMEDFKNRMEDNLSYSHTNFILDFAHGIYRKTYTDSDDKKYVEALSSFIICRQINRLIRP